MNIQAISSASVRPVFGNVKRRENTDRAATVADIYEAEDRIKAHQEELIQQQNIQLANVFRSLAGTVYRCDCDNTEEYNECLDDADKLASA